MKIDITRLSSTEAAFVLAQRLTAQKRRDRNREAKRCINENNQGTHGPATHGCRCAACDAVHARTSARRAKAPDGSHVGIDRNQNRCKEHHNPDAARRAS